MPIGKVKWYSSEKGFGFVSTEDDKEIFLHASALPRGVKDLKQGTKLDFSIADGRKGAQVLSAEIISTHPSAVKANRKPAEDMVFIIEDVIKLLDNASNIFRNGKYPEDASAQQIATLLRAVADDLDI